MEGKERAKADQKPDASENMSQSTGDAISILTGLTKSSLVGKTADFDCTKTKSFRTSEKALKFQCQLSVT